MIKYKPTEHKLAYLLPEPLYLLYSLTDAYKQQVYNINMELVSGRKGNASFAMDTKLDIESEPETDQQEIEVFGYLKEFSCG